ncbi:MAG: GTP 3',8-cyclase MoaA [Desulfurococcales archaeon]|nr:GTP 3',8-cyclase MoaA [Desulfurococcales archaeon]
MWGLPGAPAVVDAYGRPFRNLRVSVTNECNFRCIFCHIEGDPVGRPLRPGQLPPVMVPEEYGVVARAAWLLGVSSFKITGGEPLIRRDIVEVVGEISSNAPGSDVSMTSNGYLMNVYAHRLVEAGLARANISIHSLHRGRYKFITGVDGLDRALRGFKAAYDAGLRLKVNMVLLRGVNEDEVWSLADLAARYEAVLQLIELHPVGLGARFFKQYFYPLSRVEEELVRRGARVEYRGLHNRPVYTLPNGVRVEVVRPHGNPIFCAGCTRIRVSATGHLSPCLNWRGRRIHMLPRIRGAETWEEKVLAAAEALLEVNELRRPFWLARRSDSWFPARGSSRLGLPKRSMRARILGELRRRLLEEGVQVARG